MSSGGGVQTLKSAIQPRVNVGVTENQAGARMNGLFPALCPSAATFLQNDIYGRNVGHLGVNMAGAPECNVYMPPGQNYRDRIIRENLERPYVQVGIPGTLGAGDLMGRGRDVMP